MWSALRGRALSSSSSSITHQWRSLASSSSICTRHFSSSAFNSNESNGSEKNKELLSLAEVEKILKDVGADDVQVIAAPKRCEFTDYMVIATGRSPWHVRNISQALIYKAGPLIVHAVDEKARAYYDFEGLWTTETSNTEHSQDLEKAFVKVRRKNNSKKPSQARA